MKVYRPVIVWITLVGLPLHFWGKEEITSIMAPFGKIHKFHENFYTKKKADVVRVMVEVDDISAVPKTVKCSYKSVVEARSGSMLSICCRLKAAYLSLNGRRVTTRRLKNWEGIGRVWKRDGCMEQREHGEEGWHETPAARRRRRRRECKVLTWRLRGNRRAMGQRVRRNLEPQTEPNLPVTDEERDRRRKGKGICMEWAQGANEGDIEPDHVLSGSGSCDPLLVGGGLESQQAKEDSEDADSKAGPVTGPVTIMGSNIDKPIVISEGSQQDEDLGGEGKRFVKHESHVGKEKEGETRT